MPNAREYFKNKSKQESMNEVDNKIKRHRKKVTVILMLAFLILILLGVIIYTVLGNIAYKDYSVVEENERKDENSIYYQEFAGHLLRYGKDGISYVSYNSKEMWNQTYEVNNPVLDINGDSAVVGDRNGNKVYIFNKTGLVGEFETNLPIEKVKVSQQGVVAVLLKDDAANWIRYYDKAGTIIAENKASMAQSGYPIDMAVSEDGKKIMVSYLHVSSGAVTTTVAFYNFDSIGQDKIDNLVSSKEYNGMVAPMTKFLTSDISVAIGDDKILFFKGKEIPKPETEVEIEKQIKSAFYSEQYVGLVLDNNSAKNRYELAVYNLKGDEVLKETFDIDVNGIKFAGNKIIIYGNSDLLIYNMKGKKQFNKSMDGAIQNIIPMSGYHKYMVIYESKIEQIKLKL